MGFSSSFVLIQKKKFLYTPRRFAVGFLVRLRLAFGFAVCYLLVASI